MELILQTPDLAAYLEPSEVADFHHPAVHARVQEIQRHAKTDEAQARLAFLFVRDEIQHSFDLIDSPHVTITATEALEQREGICFAKAHLLAALLRGLGIPAGFCYQRVVRKGTPESGYALHGLNALYLPSAQRWLRTDPRGNKPGVYSEFSVEVERLAYPIRPEYGEIDYPYVLTHPDPAVLTAMHASKNAGELFFKRPPALQVRF